jgi:uncharacterized membrane protein YhaH (DUF805 family)
MPFAQIEDTTSAGEAIGSIIGATIGLAITVVALAGMWKMFQKAGRPGWAAIIPFYNFYVLLKICGRPGWWLVLFLIPLVNIVIVVITMLDLAKAFGKGVGFALGLIFLSPIFYCILGFGDARYQGPLAAPAANG